MSKSKSKKNADSKILKHVVKNKFEKETEKSIQSTRKQHDESISKSLYE